jgi:hypothetical protein
MAEDEAFVRSVGGLDQYEKVLGEEEKSLAQNFEPKLMHPRCVRACVYVCSEYIPQARRLADLLG